MPTIGTRFGTRGLGIGPQSRQVNDHGRVSGTHRAERRGNGGKRSLDAENQFAGSICDRLRKGVIFVELEMPQGVREDGGVVLAIAQADAVAPVSRAKEKLGDWATIEIGVGVIPSTGLPDRRPPSPL